MAKKTASAAAGEPQGFVYPGIIVGRKFSFEELSLKAVERLQELARPREEGQSVDVGLIVEMVVKMLTGPKVTVLEGEPFTKDEVEEELGYKDVTKLFRFFTNPSLSVEELEKIEGDEDPKAA